MTYTLAIEHFRGPLEKLLELVEAQTLNINQINLAAVTSGFLDYIITLEEVDVPNEVLADFLVIASKLILIKSKLLIPSLELEVDEEESLEQLEIQLTLYKKIKGAKEHIQEGWSAMPAMRSRELMMSKEIYFYPPQITTEHFLKAFARVEVEINKFRPVEISNIRVINLKEKIEEMLMRITEQPMNLRTLSQQQSKEETITLFLAILHLIRDELIWVEQTEQFGDIIVAKKSPVQ